MHSTPPPTKPKANAQPAKIRSLPNASGSVRTSQSLTSPRPVKQTPNRRASAPPIGAARSTNKAGRRLRSSLKGGSPTIWGMGSVSVIRRVLASRGYRVHLYRGCENRERRAPRRGALHPITQENTVEVITRPSKNAPLVWQCSRLAAPGALATPLL